MNHHVGPSVLVSQRKWEPALSFKNQSFIPGVLFLKCQPITHFSIYFLVPLPYVTFNKNQLSTRQTSNIYTALIIATACQILCSVKCNEQQEITNQQAPHGSVSYIKTEKASQDPYHLPFKEVYLLNPGSTDEAQCPSLCTPYLNPLALALNECMI